MENGRSSHDSTGSPGVLKKSTPLLRCDTPRRPMTWRRPGLRKRQSGKPPGFPLCLYGREISANDGEKLQTWQLIEKVFWVVIPPSAKEPRLLNLKEAADSYSRLLVGMTIRPLSGSTTRRVFQKAVNGIPWRLVPTRALPRAC